MKKPSRAVLYPIFAALFIIIGFVGIYAEKYDTDYIEAKRSEKLISDEINDDVTFDIKGAVNNPGVYTLKEGERIEKAIELAGGYTENADVEKVNLARVLNDGDEIFIPSKNEDFSVVKGGKVNICIADFDTLKTIPGISDLLASRILEYREKNGSFNEISDIKNIKGIGEKTFTKIMPYITVQ